MPLSKVELKNRSFRLQVSSIHFVALLETLARKTIIESNFPSLTCPSAIRENLTGHFTYDEPATGVEVSSAMLRTIHFPGGSGRVFKALSLPIVMRPSN